MTKKPNYSQDDIEMYCPKNRIEWRQWLESNHITAQSVWLVYFKKNSGSFTLSWSEAVDEALCFGWIDSTAKSIDDKQYKQFFTKRKPKSMWSKINKEKIKRLDEEGLIAKAGYEIIEIAKQNGSWSILDVVEELIIPEDLEEAFNKHTGSKDYFLSLSKSVKKMMLHWIVFAKRPETRQKRIGEIAELAGQNKRPKQF